MELGCDTSDMRVTCALYIYTHTSIYIYIYTHQGPRLQVLEDLPFELTFVLAARSPEEGDACQSCAGHEVFEQQTLPMNPCKYLVEYLPGEPVAHN